ncbi:Syntaxin-12 [Intoshia linei]|uniref:Syntaxin-12 n=1 Tax=Intoshia linei TaxID=1819745 RepID=A0A177B713_9BILA|nr:Syntaxin-12 [Intoshia linei]
MSNFGYQIDIINKKIFELRNKTTILENYHKKLASNRKTSTIDSIHQVENSCNEIVSNVLYLFQQLKKNFIFDKYQTGEYEKLKENYKTVIQNYTILQNQILNNLKTNNENFAEWNDNDNDSSPLINGNPFKKDMKQQTIQQFKDEDAAIKRLESDVLIINDIFVNLNKVVNEQGIVIDTIEDNIVSTHIQTEKANEDLTEAAISKEKTRRNKLIITVVLSLFALILVLILYFALR